MSKGKKGIDMKNPVAKILRTSKFRKQIVISSKGVGSYTRKKKHKKVLDKDK